MLTFHIVSLGCPKNTVDAEVMLGHASHHGLQPVEDPTQADILILNTCGFIEPAKKESIDTIFALAQHKLSGRCQRLIVTGCLVQRYAEQLANQIPEIDYLIGTNDVLHVANAMQGKGNRIQVGPPIGFLSNASNPRMLSNPGASAYIKIAEGCNRQCAFCVIPQIKGKHRSRTIDDIEKEVRHLVDQGILEINLVSQDTSAYGNDLDNTPKLSDLVRRIVEVKGVQWLRLLYLYPDKLDDALVDLLGNHSKLLPYVDMPMQHASNTVLKMRRGYDQNRLRRIVERLRNDVPNVFLRSSFIVGFPGETDKEFSDLLSFLSWARFDHVGVFRYSDEETTAAFNLTDKVSRRVSYDRFRKVMALQRKISCKNNRMRKGQKLQVLVEGSSSEHDWVIRGRHMGQAPDIDGHVLFTDSDVRPGEIWWCVVEQAMDYDLVVRAIGNEPIAVSNPRKRLPVVRL